MAKECKILIVEDDEGIGLHLEFMLNRLGYTCLEIIPSGEKAVQRAGELRPSLILMDIFLVGEMNGIEAAGIIRERYDIPFIFLTGMASEEILKAAKLSSPFAYLLKPVEEKELRAAIEVSLYKYQMEQRLRESETRYRMLFDRMTSGFALSEIIFDEHQAPVDYRFLAVNPAFEELTGMAARRLIGKTIRELLPDFNQHLEQDYYTVVTTGEPVQFERYFPFIGRYYEFKIYLSQPGQLAVLLSDITERVQAEKTVEESETRFRQLAEGVSEVFWLRSKLDQTFLYISPSYERVWGRPREDLYQTPQTFLDSAHPDDAEWVFEAQREHLEQGLPFNEEFRIIRPDGSVRWIWARTFPIYEKNGEVVRYSGIAEDITERKRSEQQLIASVQLAEKRSLRMSILRNIDHAITTHTELPEMIQSVLRSIIRLAEVNAALLFRPSPIAQAGTIELLLEGTAGIDARKIRPPVMEWMAQQAQEVMKTGHANHILRLDTQSHLGTVQLILDFGFAGCSVLPLSTKGQMKGVLFLMKRFADSPDQDLNDYFDSLALQTAIAIDNVEMFAGLKRSHAQLTQAYDATIRGWAQALELRDKETRGHSERVISLSTRLGRELGLTEDELVHFQRGVLLHDIGKMAIPDNVLLKPGPLTEEEWVLMRQHPIFAYNMLSEIEYLKPALDVPYCHHEKWDGTGYPRSLKGEEIPLMARIFTIIDTWDALTSGRPYHPPWSRQDALAYISRQSGKQFDPAMVAIFMKLMSE